MECKGTGNSNNNDNIDNDNGVGTPPAPMYATIYYNERELELLRDFPELVLMKRYIDDLFGIWQPLYDNDLERWNLFQTRLTFGKLHWVTSPRSLHVDFLDLAIRLTDGTLTTSLFKKALNLYLYIPPASCHPPGMLQGLISGFVFRIRHLCNNDDDQHELLQKLYLRLRRRGYLWKTLCTLFHNALTRPLTPPRQTKAGLPADSVFYHIEYHPCNPPRSKIQSLFKTHLLKTTLATPLPDLCNHQDIPCNVSRLIIAYSRPMNLANYLSV